MIVSVSFGPPDRVAVTTNDCPNYPERLSITDKTCVGGERLARVWSQEYEALRPRVGLSLVPPFPAIIWRG